MTVDTWYSDREAIVAIKDTLQTYLEDPRAQYTKDSRSWIHTDEPLDSATYPRIQVRKRGPTETDIISMGMDFVEHRIMILDIQFWSKQPFKWKDTSNVYHQDEELVKLYLDKIWKVLKAKQSYLYSTYGIIGLKNIDEDEPYLEPDTQRYTGTVSVRIWYFRKTA